MNQWKFKRQFSDKLQGYVWLVERTLPNNEKQQGYFKFVLPRNIYYAGPMVANEILGAKLAQYLNLPVAEWEYLNLDGKPGFVSVVKNAPTIKMWQDLPRKVQENIPHYFKYPGQLRKMFVFDIWTCNIDRGVGKNIIVYKNNKTQQYSFYLIDHGLALHGSYYKWKKGNYKHPRWLSIWQYYSVPMGFTRLIKNYQQVEPFVKEISKISPEKIDAFIKEIPSELLEEQQAVLIKKLLLYRQKKLEYIIKRWLKFRGPKEFGQRNKLGTKRRSRP